LGHPVGLRTHMTILCQWAVPGYVCLLPSVILGDIESVWDGQLGMNMIKCYFMVSDFLLLLDAVQCCDFL